MQFLVPINKTKEFEVSFFNSLAYAIQTLAEETNKWPDKVIFIGPLGKELYDIIIKNAWDLSKFNPTHLHSAVSKIRIEYSKPITFTQDHGITKGDSLHGKIINGIPGPETIAKLINFSAMPSFSVEKQERPFLEVILKRDNLP